jgi:hypothetical protein
MMMLLIDEMDRYHDCIMDAANLMFQLGIHAIETSHKECVSFSVLLSCNHAVRINERNSSSFSPPFPG